MGSGLRRAAWTLAFLFVAGPLAAHFEWIPALWGFGLFGLAGVASVLLSVLGLLAWLRGRREPVALGTSVLVALVFLGTAAPAGRYPPINDITTDVENPPRFVAAADLEANRGRDLSYPGEEFARQQRTAYPDLEPLRAAESPDVVFERVVETARQMPGWSLVRVDAGRKALEGTATTWLFRFRDDFVIEVRPTDGGSVVHMRSKSRDGRGDIGANAKRIRAFFAKLAERTGNRP
ncbi:MAG: hypothetical protein KatS3mg076_3030 [Candidatus Binatia bacterium]|nr:MAG: hypothetical protein KatS3mg076_3030 [Candidatus Binatia bacterium]